MTHYLQCTLTHHRCLNIQGKGEHFRSVWIRPTLCVFFTVWLKLLQEGTNFIWDNYVLVGSYNIWQYKVKKISQRGFNLGPNCIYVNMDTWFGKYNYNCGILYFTCIHPTPNKSTSEQILLKQICIYHKYNFIRFSQQINICPMDIWHNICNVQSTCTYHKVLDITLQGWTF